MTPLGSESTVGGNGVTCRPGRLIHSFRRHRRRKLLSHNAYQMTMTPRRCQSCRGPRRPRLLQTSERPRLTCRVGRPRGGLVEFYSWWTVVERVGPVAIRSAPPSHAGISGAVRCDFCGDSSGRVVGAAAPLHAQRAGRRLSCADHHATYHFAGCRGAETAHRSAAGRVLPQLVRI
jgi:hypothetical protein